MAEGVLARGLLRASLCARGLCHRGHRVFSPLDFRKVHIKRGDTPDEPDVYAQGRDSLLASTLSVFATAR